MAVKNIFDRTTGNPIKERFISLILNSKNARSQDQLHIHISCLPNSVNKIISKIPEREIDTNWSKKQITIPPYSFYYRKISLTELMNSNLFESVTEKVKKEQGKLEYTGVGPINRNSDTFIILSGIGTKSKGVYAERIQDHECELAEQ